MSNADLLAGYCHGKLENCRWKDLAQHWAVAGSKEGRAFGCALPVSPPPPPLKPSPPPLIRTPPRAWRAPPPPFQQEISLPSRPDRPSGAIFAFELIVLVALVGIFVVTARRIHRIWQGERHCPLCFGFLHFPSGGAL